MSDLNPQAPVPTPGPDWAGWEGSDDAYKRAGHSRKDLLKRYNQRIAVSKKWRKDEGYEDTWLRLIDMYKGKQFEYRSVEEQIAVNIAFSTVNTIVPSIAVNHPQISVNPREEPMQPMASNCEAAVNYWWRHYNWRNEVKRSVKDELIIGHGWGKVCWKYATKTRPMNPDEHGAVVDMHKQQAGDYAEQNPHLAADLPTDEEIAGAVPTDTEDVTFDEPLVERVSPFDMFIDPEATCPEDLKWIAQRIVVPLEEVKKDERYRSAARRKLKPDASTNVRWRDKEGDKGSKAYEDDVKRVTLWEYYDLRSDFYCVFTEGAEDFLLEPTDFPYPYGSPFVFLANYEVPDQFYPIGDLEALEPLQRELNLTRSAMAQNRKTFQRAYKVKRDSLQPDAQAALLQDKDNRIIYIDGDEDLNNVIVPLTPTNPNPELYNYSQQIEADVDLVSGVSEYARGASSEIRRTATEAAMIQDAANARAADKLAEVELFMGEIARRVIQLAQKFLTGEHMARVVGMDGKNSWVKFDNTAIQGEFDLEVEAGSTQPRDKTFRQQQALQLANVLSPYVGVAVQPQALVAFVLRDGFGIKDISPFIMPPAEPGPNKKLIETIAYKDVPPDVQRQMESEAGFQPSMIGPPVGGQPNPDAAEQGQMSEMGGGGEGAAPGTGPTDNPQQGAALPTSGMNIPPELLTQLEGQVGLDVG